MSSYDGPQVVPGYISHQPHYEPPIPVDHYSQEKDAQTGFLSGTGVPPKTVLGLRRTTFWLVVVIVVLVLAGAIGGGVGGSLAGKKTTSNTPASQSTSPATQSQSNPSKTTTSASSLSTSTASAAGSTSTSTPSGYTGCPGINGTLYTAQSGAKFMQYCNYDIVSSSELNFDYFAAHNLDACIEGCDATNVRDGDSYCKAAAYNFAGSDFLLCWLKNGTGTVELDTVANGVGNYSVSVVLQ